MRTNKTIITAAHDGMVASHPKAENNATPASTATIMAMGANTTKTRALTLATGSDDPSCAVDWGIAPAAVELGKEALPTLSR